MLPCAQGPPIHVCICIWSEHNIGLYWIICSYSVTSLVYYIQIEMITMLYIYWNQTNSSSIIHTAISDIKDLTRILMGLITPWRGSLHSLYPAFSPSRVSIWAVFPTVPFNPQMSKKRANLDGNFGLSKKIFPFSTHLPPFDRLRCKKLNVPWECGWIYTNKQK